MTRWEYRVEYVALRDHLDPAPHEGAPGWLENLGLEGWEYVGTHLEVFMVFKRPKK